MKYKYTFIFNTKDIYALVCKECGYLKRDYKISGNVRADMEVM